MSKLKEMVRPPKTVSFTHYSDSELSLLFMNEERLYHTLCLSTWEQVKHLAQNLYIFNIEQLADLQETYEEAQDHDDD